jgi:hypothetical protein
VKGSHESAAICSIAFRGISCLCPAHAYQQVRRLPRDASATANLFRKAGFDLVKDEREVRLGCAPWKGGAFQWVRAPPGNRSSRKQSEQSWR